VERPLGSKYVLEEPLGRGATGEVWRGHSTDGTEYAFKVLHDALGRDAETVRRFLQESAILVGLNHPNLVQVRDLVAEGETLAIVMDLVNGRDLRSVLVEHRVLAPAEACRIAAETAAGLAAVHAAGVVHRDVKPENVLLDLQVMPPAARLTDFGIAKIAEQSGSGRSTMLVGTPQYVAPEVFDGQTPTPAADVYALGVMLYEMCCGVTPFAGGSTLQILRRHVETAPGRPQGIPDVLWDFILALLDKDPAARPAPTTRVVNQLTALGHDLAGAPSAPALTEPPPAIPLIHDQLTDKVHLPPREPRREPQNTPVAGAPPRRSGKSRLIVVGAVLLVAVVGGGVAYAKLPPGKSDGNNAGVQVGQPLGGGQGTAPSGAAPTSTPTPSVSITVIPGKLPNLVGASLDQAKAALPATTEVQVAQESAPAGTPDGVVLAQDPGPGAALPKSVHLTVATSRPIEYLADLTPASGQLSTASDGNGYQLSGRAQVHALGASSSCGTSDGTVDYNLGSHYQTLTGLAGIDDASPAAKAKLTLEVFGDQRKLTSATLTLGAAKSLNISVTGVLRLTLRWSFSGVDCFNVGNATMVLGNIQLIAADGYVPTPSPGPTG
jgi:serine/threonine protein kinase